MLEDEKIFAEDFRENPCPSLINPRSPPRACRPPFTRVAVQLHLAINPLPPPTAIPRLILVDGGAGWMNPVHLV